MGLILIPLFITHYIVPANCWSFIVFGTMYATQFTLIHCEYRHPWDPLFELVGIGTAEDHNIHHLTLKYNYGHFFMWTDWLIGTYQSPSKVKELRSSKLGLNGTQPGSTLED